MHWASHFQSNILSYVDPNQKRPPARAFQWGWTPWAPCCLQATCRTGYRGVFSGAARLLCNFFTHKQLLLLHSKLSFSVGNCLESTSPICCLQLTIQSKEDFGWGSIFPPVILRLRLSIFSWMSLLKSMNCIHPLLNWSISLKSRSIRMMVMSDSWNFSTSIKKVLRSFLLMKPSKSLSMVLNASKSEIPSALNHSLILLMVSVCHCQLSSDTSCITK